MKTSPPISWLLSQAEPWVRYRTRLDLLGLSPTDSQTSADRAAMLAHPAVQSLITRAAQWPDPPLKRHNDANHPLHALGVMADFGLTVDDPGMAPLAESLTAHTAANGFFQTLLEISPNYGGTGQPQWSWMLCDAPLLLHALLAFGLPRQPLLQPAVEHLASIVRDNGWPCVCDPAWQGFRGPGRKDDPCPYATLIALRALSLCPELISHPSARAGVDMILRHWQLRKEKKYYLFGIGSDFSKLKYPFIWYDLLHVLTVLSRFEHARTDPRLQEMAALLASQQDANGCFTPTSVWMAWKGWDFAQKKEPSPWLTLLAHRALAAFPLP